MIIIGKDCIPSDKEKCKYCTLENEDDARNIGICCSAKDNRFYRWGQCIPCEDKQVDKFGR